MKIGLLCGGCSSEHEISIVSALDLYKKIKNSVFLYLDKDNDLYYIKNPTIKKIMKKKGKKIRFEKGKIKGVKTDILISLVHGRGVEDGVISAILDFYEIPYIGSKMPSSNLLMDKEITDLILKKYNINSLDKITIYSSEDVENIEYPVIVKPARAGSSLGVKVSFNEEELNACINEAFLYDDKVVLEKYLEDYKEFSVALCKSSEFHISKVEIIDKSGLIFDYNEKYKNRTKGFVHKFLKDGDLKDKIIDISKKVYEIFECKDIVRIDFLYSNNFLYVNEVNTIPGSLSHYMFDDFKLILEKLIKQELYNFNKRKQKKNLLNEEILLLNSKK